MRKPKTRPELSAWLNQELHNHKGCEEACATVQPCKQAMISYQRTLPSLPRSRDDDYSHGSQCGP